VRVALLTLAAVVSATAPSLVAQTVRLTAPETFVADAAASGAAGSVAGSVEVTVRRYTTPAIATNIEQALKTGGYPGVVRALRQAPEIGYVQRAGSKYAIKYARETETPTGRRIVIVTDKPVFFLGGGSPDAKSRAGYELAVVQLDVDKDGKGSGSLAAAARVKPAPEGGVQVDDYAEDPIKLTGVTRKAS
jgi:hypothetical protein